MRLQFVRNIITVAIFIFVAIVPACHSPKSRLKQVLGNRLGEQVKITRFVDNGGKDYLLAWRIQFPAHELDEFKRGMKEGSDEINSAKNILENLLGESLPPCVAMRRCAGNECTILFMLSQTDAYLLVYASS